MKTVKSENKYILIEDKDFEAKYKMLGSICKEAV